MAPVGEQMDREKNYGDDAGDKNDENLW